MDDGNEARIPEAPVHPPVEENGPWFAVAMVVIGLLVLSAVASVIHSLSATFG